MTEANQPSRTSLGPLLEFLPLLAFFVVNFRWGLLEATAVLLALTLVCVGILWRIERRIPMVPVVAGAFLLVFGGLTVALDDPLFIKIKPTVTSLVFAAALAGGALFRVLLLKHVFARAFQLEDRGWRILTWRWVGFFVFLAALNEWIWRSYSVDTWVAVKVFGFLPLSLAFAALQVPLILRSQKPSSP